MNDEEHDTGSTNLSQQDDNRAIVHAEPTSEVVRTENQAPDISVEQS